MLLGIDIGTTGIRAAVFEPDGTSIADARAALTYESPRPGWAEADAEGWWTATLRVLAELRALLPNVAAVGVVGQAPTAVLVDANGAPTCPSILWLDTRASAEARELGEHAYYLGPKLLWLSRHAKDAVARTRHVLQSHAFVTSRLTGEIATDHSTGALMLPLYDLAARAWKADACARVGIGHELLTPLVSAHDVVGRVTAAVAAKTGLRAGIPVVAGGGDFAAATLGAGVIDEGEACLMLGTAGNLLVPRTTPGKDDRLINAHHVGLDRWLSLGGTLAGGAQEWFRHAVVRSPSTRDTEDSAVRGLPPSHDVLDAEATRTQPGADALLFLPYLQGERTPIWDVDARGAFVGLGLHHGRGHMWRAVLEGIALGFCDCAEVVAADGVKLTRIVAANGGGKSALFRQILCDALGVPLSYAAKSGGTVAGAAILAGLGAGVLGGVTEARAFRGDEVRHEPDAAAHGRYREFLGLRRTAYQGLKGVFSGLSALGRA